MIAFNLVQDGVNPGSGRVPVVLLHQFMGGIPLARQGEVYCLEKMLAQDG